MSKYSVEYEIRLKDLYSKVADGMNTSTTRLEKSISNVEKRADSAGETFRRLRGYVVAAFSVAAIRGFAQSTEDAFILLEGIQTRMQTVFGSQAGANLDYVKGKADELGIALEESANGYVKLSAAARGTILEGRGAREVFEGVAIASAGMKLSADQTNGAFVALEQILSKGKVQAEELRGQLGERIPGAFQIAARAMNMTTQELDKFMSDGKLIAEEFLPRFAAQLKTEFGDAAVNAAQSATAAIQRQKDEMFLLEAQIGQRLIPVMYEFRKLQLLVVSAIGKLVDLFKEYKTAIIAAVAGLIAYKTQLIITNGLMYLAAVRSGALTVSLWAQALANGALTSAWKLLTAAMMANPIGLVVTAISLLTAGIVYAYNEFEEFRGAVWGVWEATKQVFSNIYDYFKRYFMPVIDAIKAVKEGRWGDALKAGGEAFLKINPVTGGLMLAYDATKAAVQGDFTKGVADAYRKGVAEGIDDFRKGNAVDSFSGMGSDSMTPTAGGFVPESSSTATSLKSSKVGAKQPENIYINIDTLGQITLQNTTIKESLPKIKQMVQEVLISAVNDTRLAR